jgi:hypothetical protein
VAGEDAAVDVVQVPDVGAPTETTGDVPADSVPAALETPPPPPLPLPTRFRRAAVRKQNKWELPRSFTGFTAADPSRLSVRGAAPKCIILNDEDSNIWYMAKGAEDWGIQETHTEFFISQLGEFLGFPMAHSGLLLVDGEPRFVSKNFLVPGESLRHGSLMLESFFDYDLTKVGKNPWEEQRTYDFDVLDEVLQDYCGEDYPAVRRGFIEMLVFDALIGSMDRHMQNWGVIETTTIPRQHRFAPIFDSARALLWNYDEGKIQRLSKSDHQLGGYANRARPKIGCSGFGKAVNHFLLVEHLFRRYPVETSAAITKVIPEMLIQAGSLMREYPFRDVFTPLRRQTVMKILMIRAGKIVAAAAGKGEGHV